jgi:hypothetical protein
MTIERQSIDGRANSNRTLSPPVANLSVPLAAAEAHCDGRAGAGGRLHLELVGFFQPKRSSARCRSFVPPSSVNAPQTKISRPNGDNRDNHRRQSSLEGFLAANLCLEQ